MKPEQKSLRLLGVTRSKGKMYEYGLPEEHHIAINNDPVKLFFISIALLGDLSAAISRGEKESFLTSELKEHLRFSAYFFDAYLQSKLNGSYDSYLLLLGAASYYLCDLPGSSSVLIQHIQERELVLEAGGLENLLLFLLRGDWETDIEEKGIYGTILTDMIRGVCQFYRDGEGEDNLFESAERLRSTAYEEGTPRQLLFADVAMAVLRRKIENSTWKTLPLYSNLPLEIWRRVLQKDSFIKELWPAQHLLGKMGVLQGKSAVVQMPTSAGKTKSTELILRSAFLAKRTSLAVIIAPFRALCNEIQETLAVAFDKEAITVNGLSDVLQTDYDIVDFMVERKILVATPEKMLYILRHEPLLGQHIGLLIFDEGHQFDDETRGVTYELLLTSLLSQISKDTQKVLISAVLNDAETIGEWLNGEANVVEGKTLFPTSKSVGFVSWNDRLGQIKYPGVNNFGQYEFFVPRVIERMRLNKKGRERTERAFPDKDKKESDIALYLGLKLVSNGAVALFCGKKDTISTLCNRLIDIVERGFSLPPVLSDPATIAETQGLEHLYCENFGSDAPEVKCTEYGVFTHHGSMPHGIRAAVEYAMQHHLIRFVICTSTLAQGVNLPIRYLIVMNPYQGKQIMRKRDFLNLIGRVGRAGMHTEGSIIFANHGIYDEKNSRNGKWNQIQMLLSENDSETCSSSMRILFSPLVIGDYEIQLDEMDFVQKYIDAVNEDAFVNEIFLSYKNNEDFSLDDMKQVLMKRVDIICELESFLLSHAYNMEKESGEEDAVHLAEGTLAFFLADDEEKEKIRQIFRMLYNNIVRVLPQPARRVVYGKSLFGLRQAEEIERWVQSNEDQLCVLQEAPEILDMLWPLFSDHIHVKIFKKFDPSETLKEAAQQWIQGSSFGAILSMMRDKDVRIIHGAQRWEIKIKHVVEVCENGFSYEGGHIVNAVCEFLEMIDPDKNREAVRRIRLFQKQLKYGLPTQTIFTLYELGFSDRVIAQNLAKSLNLTNATRRELIKELKTNRVNAEKVIDAYPSYFREQLKHCLDVV